MIGPGWGPSRTVWGRKEMAWGRVERDLLEGDAAGLATTLAGLEEAFNMWSG